MLDMQDMIFFNLFHKPKENAKTNIILILMLMLILIIATKIVPSFQRTFTNNTAYRQLCKNVFAFWLERSNPAVNKKESCRRTTNLV